MFIALIICAGVLAVALITVVIVQLLERKKYSDITYFMNSPKNDINLLKSKIKKSG